MKKMIFIVGVVLGVIIVGGFLFMNLSPQFGKAPTAKQKKEYEQSGHYKDGKFVNESPTFMDMHYMDLLKDLFKSHPNRRPKMSLPVKKVDLRNPESLDRVTWLGHSSFLLEIDGKKILLDPMFSMNPLPVPMFGTKRYYDELPIELKELPLIDAIIISHDHYDHMDYSTIQALKDKTAHFFAPLGVGNHLIGWGVEKEKVTELNWWDETEFNGLELVATPARHFSGRGIMDRAATLWSSWVIKGKKSKVFFSGDSGYDDHFKKIGEKYGPFDISLMECGQYNKDWLHYHMMPEQTAQAAVDANSKLFIPIHWGAFTLSLHDWFDPVERAVKKANELGQAVTTPMIGETVVLGGQDFPKERWWESLKVKEIK